MLSIFNIQEIAFLKSFFNLYYEEQENCLLNPDMDLTTDQSNIINNVYVG